MSGELAGRVGVITGSTQGLGAAVARLFVREGASVVLSGLSRTDGEALVRELGRAAVFHETELARVEDCKALIDAALRAFGGIDVLVNCAADTNRSTLGDFTPELFDRQFHVNLRAPLLLAQAALPSLKERRGVIINIGSVNAYMGEPRLLVYAATKGALQTASKNLANVLKFERVRVFCLNVGWMDTEGERAMMAKLGHPPDFLEQAGKTWPLGRQMKPEEVAEACLFFASDRGSAFSGAVVELEQFPVGPLVPPALDKGVT
jgi:NAD(P)-dependent dehydrogenase (short-subunit alcohol dehydrogenase family)